MKLQRSSVVDNCQERQIKRREALCWWDAWGLGLPSPALNLALFSTVNAKN